MPEDVTLTFTDAELAYLYNVLSLFAHAPGRTPYDRDVALRAAARFGGAESASYLRKNPLPAE